MPAHRNGNGSGKRRARPIGEIIKIARKKRKLSADQVAAKCNVSRSRVYQWESGDYVMPKNFQPISAALHIPIKTLRDHNGLRR